MNVQMLAELEEVIQFKLVPDRREVIREMWWNRLRVITRRNPGMCIGPFKPRLRCDPRHDRDVGHFVKDETETSSVLFLYSILKLIAYNTLIYH